VKLDYLALSSGSTHISGFFALIPQIFESQRLTHKIKNRAFENVDDVGGTVQRTKTERKEELQDPGANKNQAAARFER
jgi:hypothetical protein